MSRPVTEVAAAGMETGQHIAVLDGWRGVSIMLVLVGHLLPIGPRGSGMNDAVAAAGMALFFTLSGFLITSFLLNRPDVRAFLIRRIFRIVPLAWLYVIVTLTLLGADTMHWVAHLFFFENLPPFWLFDQTGHLWSLAVEMQFYALAAALVGIAGRRGLYLLPLLGLAVTAGRVWTGTGVSIVTWLRADEILAGCSLALLFARCERRPVHWLWPVVLALLLMVASHPAAGAWQYLRPYAAASLVGVTMLDDRHWVGRLLRHAVLAYLAKISYALYVLHVGLAHTWLGTGEGWVKYAKRPLLAVVLFALAHLSTTQFESRAIAAGRRLAQRQQPGIA